MSTPPLDMAVLAAQLAQNPALTAELQALLAAAQPASSAVAAPSIQTQGGAGVGGSVSVQGGGHFIGRDFILIVQQCVPSAQEAEAVTIIDHYLKALAKDLAGLKLGDIDNALDPTRNKPLELTEIYVPLDTELEIPEDAESLGAWLANPKPSGGILTLNGMPLAIESGMLGIGPKMRRVSVIEALDHHRELTLLGKPGSGKSTCGAYVLLSLAQAWHRPADELTRLEMLGATARCCRSVSCCADSLKPCLQGRSGPVRVICGTSLPAISRTAGSLRLRRRWQRCSASHATTVRCSCSTVWMSAARLRCVGGSKRLCVI